MRGACAVAVVGILGGLLASDVAPGEPTAPQGVATFRLNGQTFTLPAGFVIEQVAGPPLVDRPITADFDEQGRLYVSDSSGTNDPVQKQLAERPHRILRLEDSDGDGRFDRSVVFADKMMFPEGTMWLDGSLYVAAPPSIWKLTDTDGDGVADRREEWFNGKTLTGCANDLHGPYRGPDGWVYWCKGAFAEQTYERPGKKPLVTKASHIFRARPDGSGIEPVMTGGMDNPVDVAFTPGGERIFTTTFLQRPAGGRRDGLIHAVYGGIYGKDHAVIYDHPWTSPELMPVLSHLGPAAPCGLTSYESAVFGEEYRHNLFAALFNLHKVTRHVLEPDGAGFRSRDEDFLVSDSIDFHPTDVLEDADGSLIVVDTGGWYKLCCPTSQLHKPDVLGAVYRVRRTGAPRVEDPRGRKLDWEKMTAKRLVQLLGDERPAVRWRAVESLGKQGARAVPALAEAVGSSESPEVRRHAVWAATRIDHPDARAAVRRALRDTDETVRQAAIHSVSVRRDREAMPELLKLLQSESPHNRRAAAEALGRIGDPAAIPALLAAAGEADDRVLHHSLTYALIEIADPDATAAGLSPAGTNAARSAAPRTRRAALVALDQMEGGRIAAESVIAELGAADDALRESAWWIVGRHPEWGGKVAGLLRDRLKSGALPDAERAELVRRAAQIAGSPEVQAMLAGLVREAGGSPEGARSALRAMAAARPKKVPEAWVAALTESLGGGDRGLIAEAIATVRALQVPPKIAGDLPSRLREIGANAALPAETRLAALAAAPGGLDKPPPPLFRFLLSALDPEQPVAARTLAAEALTKARLDKAQLLELAEILRTVGSLEVERLTPAFARTKDEDVGRKLVEALRANPAKTALRADLLKPVFEKMGPALKEPAAELLAEIDVGAEEQRAQLERLLASMKGGDVRRGQAVFHSAKAACAACHAIGYLGGTTGPDLTRIGKVRTERDLLESVVFPSASLVQSYEPVLVITLSGKPYNGVIREETAQEVILTTGPNEEVRIPRAEIEEVRPSKVSVMPAGLEKQLTPQELADLIAFLKSRQ